MKLMSTYIIMSFQERREKKREEKREEKRRGGEQ